MLSFYLKVMEPFSSQVSLAQNTMAESSICVRTSENVSLSETETTDQIQHTTGLNQRFQWEYMRYTNVINYFGLLYEFHFLFKLSLYRFNANTQIK